MSLALQTGGTSFDNLRCHRCDGMLLGPQTQQRRALLHGVVACGRGEINKERVLCCCNYTITSVYERVVNDLEANFEFSPPSDSAASAPRLEIPPHHAVVLRLPPVHRLDALLAELIHHRTGQREQYRRVGGQEDRLPASARSCSARRSVICRMGDSAASGSSSRYSPSGPKRCVTRRKKLSPWDWAWSDCPP